MVRSVIKEGGTGSVAQEIIAARQEKERERETGWAGNTKGGKY